MSTLEENFKNTGVLLGILTFVAYIKQYIYYQYFGIDISSYMSIEEVFTPFIDDLAFNGLLLLIGLLGAIPLYQMAETMRTNVKTPLIHFLLYLVFVGIIACSYFFYRSLFIQIATVFSIVLMLWSIKMSSKMFLKYEKTHPTSVYLLSIISFLITCNLIFTFLDAAKKESEYQKTTYVFKLNDKKTITTDSLNIYLGRTEKNFFIARIDSNKVAVYNTSEINFEEIIKKKKL